MICFQWTFLQLQRFVEDIIQTIYVLLYIMNYYVYVYLYTYRVVTNNFFKCQYKVEWEERLMPLPPQTWEAELGQKCN